VRLRSASFAPEIADAVVLIRDLGWALSLAVGESDERALAAAWRRLEHEAAKSPGRRAAHEAYARRRRWSSAVRGGVAFVVASLFVGSVDAQSALPDPSRTPGAVNSAVGQATIGETICVPGWTRSVRPPVSYTEDLKRRQIREFGYADRRLGHYQEDHLVPLELGGDPSDPRNLWPEPKAAPGGWGPLGSTGWSVPVSCDWRASRRTGLPHYGEDKSPENATASNGARCRTGRLPQRRVRRAGWSCG
jgi:hypothetical protein